ncbi:DUF2304 domain-containing protein [bacterium]|nr:DUF2304 domain-containing protein [bacterium]
MTPPVDIVRIQYIGVIASLCFLLFVFHLMRSKHLRIEYSLLWLFFGVAFLFFSVSRTAMDSLSAMIGIAYSPSALLLILLMAHLLILIQFSVVISSLSDKNRDLAQSLALLELRVRELERRDSGRDAHT